MHSTLNKEEINTTISWKLQKLATFIQGTGFPTADLKLSVFSYGQVLEQKIEGTEKSIY